MKLLYKYVSPERINDLLDGKIRFTQPGAFNDPFEIHAIKFVDEATVNEQWSYQFWKTMLPMVA